MAMHSLSNSDQSPKTGPLRKKSRPNSFISDNSIDLKKDVLTMNSFIFIFFSLFNLKIF